MTLRFSRGLLTLFLLLGMAASPGCGGGGGFSPTLDTGTDGDDVDATGDVSPDGDSDAPIDVPLDGADVPGDAPGDVPGDVPGDDAGGGSRAIPFTVETSGGARTSSTSYQLEVFIAPVRPVGTAVSTSYTLKLGPAGIRSEQ